MPSSCCTQASAGASPAVFRGPQRDVERAHQRGPALTEGEEAIDRACETQRLAATAGVVELLEQRQHVVDPLWEPLRVTERSFHECCEEFGRLFDSGGDL